MSQSTTRRRPHRDPDQHATAIAQAVDRAWHKADHSGRRDVALSVVAALSLVTQRDPRGPDLADQLRRQTAEDFTSTVQAIYAALLNARPDLTHLVYPLMAWVFDEPARALQDAAKRTADAALGEGQLDLSGTSDRYDTDLLGIVLTLLKTRTAGKANAQIYTPTPVADMTARMTPPEEDTAVQDPAVGTGGLFRAAAQAMREHNRDPATVCWYGADIDELAIAACAVNSLLWDLGPRILLCVANTLAESDWETRAHAQRAEILRLTQSIRRDKLMINAVRAAEKLGRDECPRHHR